MLINIGPRFFLEAFGYLGTALVIVSMLMTSVVKLRIINMCGAVISAIYAAISGAWPVVLLNVSLTAINLVQLLRKKTAPAEGGQPQPTPQKEDTHETEH